MRTVSAPHGYRAWLASPRIDPAARHDDLHRLGLGRALTGPCISELIPQTWKATTGGEDQRAARSRPGQRARLHWDATIANHHALLAAERPDQRQQALFPTELVQTRGTCSGIPRRGARRDTVMARLPIPRRAPAGSRSGNASPISQSVPGTCAHSTQCQRSLTPVTGHPACCSRMIRPASISGVSHSFRWQA